MSFKFNFDVTPQGDEQKHAIGQDPVEKSKRDENYKEAVEILPSKAMVEGATTHTDTLTLRDGSTIVYTRASNKTNELTDSTAGEERDVRSHSDLIPGVYEGGLKVWECSIDLANYLTTLDIVFRGVSVLEVGCGVGIPGLLALQRGATVHFQDFNEDVLRTRTIPSCSLNQHNADSNTRYFAGDWSTLKDLLSSLNLRYDMILTSETIYNTDNYAKLLNLMDTVLTPDGVIYVAAKIHYFGIGGGTNLFQEYVCTHSDFDVTTVHSIDASLKREILQLKRRSRDVSKSQQV